MSKDQPPAAAAGGAGAIDKHSAIKKELERIFDDKLTKPKEVFSDIDRRLARDYNAQALEGPNKDSIFRIKASSREEGWQKNTEHGSW